MSREIIAMIKLAQGESGYYDELSRIHLTVGNPQREIYAGTNCTQLRRSVKSGRIKLLSGSLGQENKIDFNKNINNRFVSSNSNMVQTSPIIENAEQQKIENKIKEKEIQEKIFVEESGTEEIEIVKPDSTEVEQKIKTEEEKESITVKRKGRPKKTQE